MATIVRFALRVVVLAVIFSAVTALYGGIRVLGNADATLGVSGTHLWIAELLLPLQVRAG